VLFLIAVFAGLVVPRLSGVFGDYQFYKTQEQVASLLRSAFYGAITNNRVYCLTIRSSEKTLTLSEKELSLFGADVTSDETSSAVLILPPCIDRIASTDSVVFFYPDGTSTDARITLSAAEHKTVVYDLGGHIDALRITAGP